jgi:hypothetical protein
MKEVKIKAPDTNINLPDIAFLKEVKGDRSWIVWDEYRIVSVPSSWVQELDHEQA